MKFTMYYLLGYVRNVAIYNKPFKKHWPLYVHIRILEVYMFKNIIFI